MAEVDPVREACTLSAFIHHIEHFLRENPGIDPYLLIKVNGRWCSVRAGIEATGEHRNAVAIEYLPPNSAGIVGDQEYYKVLVTEGSTKRYFMDDVFSRREDAKHAIDCITKPDGQTYSVVKVVEIPDARAAD